MIEPAPGGEATWFGLGLTADHYPLVYMAKIAVTIIAIVLVWSEYRKQPLGLTPLAILVGLIGSAFWIWLATAGYEKQFLEAIGKENWITVGQRTAFEPFRQLGDRPAMLYGFLAVRFIGLVLVVPIIEEFFLRGFLMRFVTANDWQKVTFATISRLGLAVGTIFPLLSHPASESLAVVVWFSLITWLITRTHNIWDCIVAHAITNLVLGVYVLKSAAWMLW
jgi:CAAX prenyl protease-like protein